MDAAANATFKYDATINLKDYVGLYSNDKDKFTDNVVIMPVNTDELSSLIDKSSEYDEIISKVHKLFEVDKINFDIEWREKFMGAII